MEEWGNQRANEYWEANLPSNVYKPKEGDAVRTVEKFIRDKYEYKRYVGSSVPAKHSHSHEDNHAAHSHAQNQAPAPQRRASAAAPKPQAPEAPKPAPVVQSTNLIDFLDDNSSSAVTPMFSASTPQSTFDPFAPTSAPPSVPTQAPPAASAPVPQQQSTQFGDFMSFTTPVAQSTQPTQTFDAFSGPEPTPSFSNVNSQPQTKPQTSADAILSLYSMNRPQAGAPMMGAPMMGASGYPSHMGMPQQQPPMMQMGQPQYHQPSQPGMAAPHHFNSYANAVSLGAHPSKTPVNPFAHQQHQAYPHPPQMHQQPQYQQAQYQQTQYQQQPGYGYPPANPFAPQGQAPQFPPRPPF